MNLRLVSAAVVDVLAERARQDEIWGPPKDLPDGTGPNRVVLGMNAGSMRQRAQWRTDRAMRLGQTTFEEILTEEWAEVVAEDDPVRLRAELVQAAAVAVKWVEAIDRRTAVADVGDGS